MVLALEIHDDGLLHQNGLLSGLKTRQLIHNPVMGPSVLVKKIEFVIAEGLEESAHRDVHDIDLFVFREFSETFAQFLNPYEKNDRIQVKGFSTSEFFGDIATDILPFQFQVFVS